MPVIFENYAFSFQNDKGKPVFVPSDRGRKIGTEVRQQVSARIDFEPHFFHFAKGAHVAALHAHRDHRFFARLDLKNFFYSVARNRVKAALKEIGVPYAEHYAKWSTVRNPYNEPRYSLPYGFPQSPILATLVLRLSALGTAISDLPSNVLRSVYLDDIAISADDQEALMEAFAVLKAACAMAQFSLNDDKIEEPAETINLFNCDLSHGQVAVSDARVAKFYAGEISAGSGSAFESYRAQVADGNHL